MLLNGINYERFDKLIRMLSSLNRTFAAFMQKPKFMHRVLPEYKPMKHMIRVLKNYIITRSQFWTKKSKELIGVFMHGADHNWHFTIWFWQKYFRDDIAPVCSYVGWSILVSDYYCHVSAYCYRVSICCFLLLETSKLIYLTI